MLKELPWVKYVQWHFHVSPPHSHIFSLDQDRTCTHSCVHTCPIVTLISWLNINTESRSIGCHDNVHSMKDRARQFNSQFRCRTCTKQHAAQNVTQPLTAIFFVYEQRQFSSQWIHHVYEYTLDVWCSVCACTCCRKEIAGSCLGSWLPAQVRGLG